MVARLHAAIEKALQAPDVRDRMAAAGGEVIPASSEQFGALIRAERVRYAKLIGEAKIKPD